MLWGYMPQGRCSTITMERLVKLLEYFFIRIIFLEILYAVMRADFHAIQITQSSPYTVLPDRIFIDYVLARGWYTLGDCCVGDRVLQHQTDIPGVCFIGPYAILYRASDHTSCTTHLKYGRQPLYIQ